MNNALLLIALSVLSFGLSAFGQASPDRSEYPTPTVREEQIIVVDGQREIWRLEWKDIPNPDCGLTDTDGSLNCPCIGFAYGEGGDLSLVRLRRGYEIDRLRLTPLFTEQDRAVVQRWLPDYNQDFRLVDRANFAVTIKKRPSVQVMHFADYDHDGRATEFYLQTEALPCGKSVGVVIGVSTNDPSLHVFGTASSPNKTLYLQQREWEAIRKARSGPVSIVDWSCGDHAADTQTELQLNWSHEGINGIRREYTCPENGGSRRLVKEAPLSAAEN